MSVRIGVVNGPHPNGPHLAADVWASTGGVELALEADAGTFEPVAARNLAALLVRSAEEVEFMRRNAEREIARTGSPPTPDVVAALGDGK